MQMYPQAKGQAAKAINTLAAMISGIVGSKRTSYGAIASKTCSGPISSAMIFAIVSINFVLNSIVSLLS
jgi:hypothetical protein